MQRIYTCHTVIALSVPQHFTQWHIWWAFKLLTAHQILNFPSKLCTSISINIQMIHFYSQKNQSKEKTKTELCFFSLLSWLITHFHHSSDLHVSVYKTVYKVVQNSTAYIRMLLTHQCLSVNNLMMSYII